MGLDRYELKAVLATLSMTDVAKHYSFTPNRAGFIKCPFHADKSASCKIYDEPGRGWHCFGCGAGGDPIDFVKLLYDVPFKQAVERLNSDFGLCLDLDKPVDKAKVSKLIEQRKAEEARKHKHIQEYTENSTKYRKVCEYIKQHPPSADGEPTQLYVLALKTRTELELYFETNTLKEW